MASLKESLLERKIPEREVNKITAYIDGAKKDEERKDKKPVGSNDSTMLFRLVMKYWNLGLTLDGVNVVITGRNMGMITYHGYKNKVLQTYPGSTFDVQLVREGDTFQVSKESGSVMYSHNFGDPFGESEIKGAYCVIKNKTGEYLELLGPKDYANMKGASKQAKLWGEWESEFWLKSVIKRACKRHFNDVTAELDKVDNEDYGMVSDEQFDKNFDDQQEKFEAAVASINSAKDLDQLRTIFNGLGKIGNLPDVMKAKDIKKEELMAQPPTKGPLAEKTEDAPAEPDTTADEAKAEEAANANTAG